MKDEDLKDKELQMEDTYLNPSLTEELIKEKDLNIEWTNKEGVEGANDNIARLRVMIVVWGICLGPLVI